MLDKNQNAKSFIISEDNLSFGEDIEIRSKLSINGDAHLDHDSDALQLPLLSIIIVNRNYGAYIGRTLKSVKNQDYPNIECLIVDNSSTDDSIAVIESHIHNDDRFRLIRLDENIGQLGGALLAFEQINGAFVSFVDSDDQIFPSYASTHIQVHLALPQSVGLTSSASVEINNNNQILNSRWSKLRTNGDRLEFGLLPAENVVRLGMITDNNYEKLSRNAARIPRQIGGWHWSPGSSNMFRTSILKFLKVHFRDIEKRRATDGFLNYLVHAITGSATINLPLSAYRIHGQNYFAKRESISDLTSGEQEFFDHSIQLQNQSIDIFLDGLDKIGYLLGHDIWTAIEVSTNAFDKRRSIKFYRDNYIIKQIKKNSHKLRRHLGTQEFVRDVFKRFGFKTAISIVAKSFS